MAKKMQEQLSAKPGTWTRGRDTIMSLAQTRASLAAVLLLFIGGVYTLREFLPSLVWAVIFAIGVWPLFKRLAARWPKHRKELLPGLIVLAVLVVFVLPLTMIAAPLIEDSHALAQWVEQARHSGVPPPALLSTLPFGPRLVTFWQSNIGQPGELSALASHALKGGLLTTGRRFGAEALHRLVLLGFMLLALFFLLRDADDVIAQFRVAARRAFGAAGEDIGRQLVLSVHGTINGLVLVGLAEGVIIGIAYVIAGVPHATLFGLITALLAMVPFGAGVAVVLATLALLAMSKVAWAVAILGFGLLVSFCADHFARPVLIGGATRLPFIWVLLGILGGVGAWGLLGLFLGPAILAALILLWREWVGSQQGPINPSPEDI